MPPPPARQPPQQAPPVQRLRVRYAKRGRLRFTSHRDFSRAFERAVVRARIPMAYSSGFNPHPRISYAGASPTGAASEAEYLEIGLAQVLDPDDVRRALADALPDGLDVLEVVDGGTGSLADHLVASRWSLVLDAPVPVTRDAVTAFLAATAVPVERMTKKGLRSFDCRAPVVALTVREHAAGRSWTSRSGTPCRPCVPTTCSPAWPRSPGCVRQPRHCSPACARGPSTRRPARSATRSGNRRNNRTSVRPVRY